MEDTASVTGVLTANDTAVTMTATGSDSTTLSLDASAPTSGAYYTIAATGTGGAKVTTGGYLPTNTEKTDSTTLNKYIKRATTSKTNGTASAIANAGTASIKTQPSASASITKTGIDAGISSSATSYYVTATANSNSGVVTATGGSASASVTASSTTVSAGYNPSAITTSTTASSTGTKTGSTATTTAATASKSETVYLKESNIGVTSSKPSGYIENTTAVVPTSGYLKLDAGYMPATCISLATLVPNDADITNDVTGSNKIRTGTTVYDKDGNLITGTMNDITPVYTVGEHAIKLTGSIALTNSNVSTTL
jgi:mucin-22